MFLRNKSTDEDQNVRIGDILYSVYEGDKRRVGKVTWSFPCQGFVIMKDNSYILGPGNTIYELGINAFKTAEAARKSSDRLRTGIKKEQFRLVKMSEEEMIKV